jgi:hypothetical protein
MERKKVIRSIITLALFIALVVVIIVSQGHDYTNPHSSIPKETWLRGPKGHGFAVNNNQNPSKQCYECHVKKSLGGKEYCQACHNQTGIEVNLPN